MAFAATGNGTASRVCRIWWERWTPATRRTNRAERRNGSTPGRPRCRHRGRPGVDPFLRSARFVRLVAGVHRSHQIRHTRDAVPFPVAANAIEQLGPDEWINEVRRANLHGRCARDHELE